LLPNVLRSYNHSGENKKPLTPIPKKNATQHKKMLDGGCVQNGINISKERTPESTL